MAVGVSGFRRIDLPELLHGLVQLPLLRQRDAEDAVDTDAVGFEADRLPRVGECVVQLTEVDGSRRPRSL